MFSIMAAENIFSYPEPSLISTDSCNTCSAFNCDNCRISGNSSLMTDCSASQYRAQAPGQDGAGYQNTSGGIIPSNNYVYAGNNSSCAIPSTYSNCYAAASPSQGSDGRGSWAPPAQCYVPEGNGHNPSVPAADPQIQEMYQFSPLSGDLFQPEEIFQLDQPLNQSKVHRLQTPPQTLLDLGSGTIQLKGTVVANNSTASSHLNDSQYYSYESLPVDTTPNRSSASNNPSYTTIKCPPQGSTYQYQASINCGSEKLLNHFPTSGYCESPSLWKDGSDENGNTLLKPNRIIRKSPQDLHYQQPQIADDYHHYRSQETFGYPSGGCHEAQQQRITSCYNPQQAGVSSTNTPSSYFIQSSSYLSHEISTGIAPEQNSLPQFK